jgi:hypothetical protein
VSIFCGSVPVIYFVSRVRWVLHSQCVKAKPTLRFTNKVVSSPSVVSVPSKRNSSSSSLIRNRGVPSVPREVLSTYPDHPVSAVLQCQPYSPEPPRPLIHHQIRKQ